MSRGFAEATVTAFLRVVKTAWGMPVLNFGALAAFGILIPRRYGLDFLDIRLILAYSFIPMLFVAPAVTSAMRAGQPARSSSMELYAHVIAIIFYGWLIGLIVMALGLATVNYVYSPPTLLLPPAGVLPGYGIFSFAAVAFVAALGAYIALLFSPLASLNTLRFGFLALLVFFYVGVTWLPLSWQVALSGTFAGDGFPPSALAASAVLLLFAGGLMSSMRPGTALTSR